MKLREKFMTVCGGCDGCGEYEEPIGGFENEVTYKLTKCDCEDGKELDWRKIHTEIKQTKVKIKEYQELVNFRLQLAREYCVNRIESLTFQAIKSMIEAEDMVTVLEMYLAELEEIQ